MRRRNSILLAIAAIVALSAAPTTVVAGGENEDGVLRILLVGSSLVRGVKPYLQEMLEDEGIETSIRAVAPSLGKLVRHARSPRSANYIDGKRGQPWDYVILQENGGIPISESAGSYAAIRTLHQKITAAGAKTMLFMVWRDRPVSPTTPEGDALWQLLRGTPNGSVGNIPIAFELDIGVVPVGWTIRAARIAGGAPFDEGLYKGGTGHHLSQMGMYLGACAVYSALVGETPLGMWAPNNFGSSEIGFIQGVAEQVVLGAATDWNLDVTNPPPY